MKKPIVTISNDWHISENNVNLIIKAFKEQLEKTKELKLNDIFVLGDIFTSRKAQSLDCLDGFSTILDMCEEYNITLHAIPGNHDKTNYESTKSFLKPFKTHKYFSLYENVERVRVNDQNFIFLPFFNEELLTKELSTIINPFQTILLTHAAFKGSVNNDGSIVDCNFDSSLVKHYQLVLSGHYHNYQRVSEKIFHLPSIIQSNFGEDEKKGFTILYDDYTFDIVKTSFKKYKKIIIDLDKNSSNDIFQIVQKFANSEDFIRFEFTGDKIKLDHLDTKQMLDVGIDVKKKIREIDVLEKQDIQKYSSNDLFVQLEEFCETNDLSYNIASNYLKEALK